MTHGRNFFDRLTAWSPVLLLGGLAALTYWLDAQVQQPPPRRDGSTRHDPDLFVERFRAVSYGADGQVLQSLAAAGAQHYPDDQSTDFISPSIVLTEPGRPRFEVSANKGTVSGDRETVTFLGNVRAVRAATPATGANGSPSGPITVTTESLRVLPKTGRADTNDAVTIEEPRGIMHAVGIELDNQAKTLKLKSGVRGSLQPPSSAK